VEFVDQFFDYVAAIFKAVLSFLGFIEEHHP
jgi:hypothetical protein